jgi:hypothetical protein
MCFLSGDLDAMKISISFGPTHRVRVEPDPSADLVSIPGPAESWKAIATSLPSGDQAQQ